jgi:nickel-dependent lactate racemase
MRVVLPWGRETVSLELPTGWNPELILPAYRSTCYPHRRTVEESLLDPIASPRLAEKVQGASSVLVVVPDWSRPSRASMTMLTAVLTELQIAGIDRKQVTVAVATGAHQDGNKSGSPYLRTIGKVADGSSVVVHDCRGKDVVEMGETRLGTRVILSNLVVSHDAVVLTGLVFAHYFAGFSGGVKPLLPGLSSLETIMANHRLSISGESPGKLANGVARAQLSGNPVAGDIAEVGQWVNPDFIVNTVVAGDGEVLGCFSGHFAESHRKACRYAYNAFKTTSNTRADVVLASAGGFPFDCNLLQAHKSLINAVDFAKEGASVILMARCDEGIGGSAFEKWLAAGSAEEIWHRATSDYSMSAQTAMSTREILDRFDVTLVSGISAERMESLGLPGVGTLEEAIQKVGRGQRWPKVAVLPESYVTLSGDVECRI